MINKNRISRYNLKIKLKYCLFKFDLISLKLYIEREHQWGWRKKKRGDAKESQFTHVAIESKKSQRMKTR